MDEPTRNHKALYNIIIGLLALVLVAGGASSYYTFVYNKMTTSISHARVVPYNDLASLEEAADLVLIGSPTDAFEDRDHRVTYFEGGKAQTIQDYYTLTKFEVHRVIQSNDPDVQQDKSIEVIEPVGLVQEFTGRVKLKFEDYSEMEKGKTYVIFLKKMDSGHYSIMSLAYGKYSVGNHDGKNFTYTDTNDLTEIENREKIKMEIKEKYNI